MRGSIAWGLKHGDFKKNSGEPQFTYRVPYRELEEDRKKGHILQKQTQAGNNVKIL